MKESRKEKGVLGRLFQHMGMFKITMVIAIILSAVSSVINLYAFVCVYNVAKEIVQSLGNIHSLDQTYMVDMGWRAVFLILTSFGLYGMALLFSHITAFNTVAKLRIQIVRHIGNLPLGYHTTNPSGKQRKIIEKNSDNLETLIAHQIPDFAGAVALPVAFLVFMFVYDWRLSLICLIPILVGFGILYYMLKDESELHYILDDGNTTKTLSEEEFEQQYPSPVIEWWTYDEYKNWLDNEKETLQSVIGQKGWTSAQGEFVWTQEMVDETIAEYEKVLQEIKDGMMYSKTVDGEQDIMVGYNPEDIMTGSSYDYFVKLENGEEKLFGPYETPDELLAAVESFCNDQVKLGNMDQSEAREIVSQCVQN